MPHVQLSFPLRLLLAGPGSPLATAEQITAQDLLRMRRGGLRDATILDFIQTYQAHLSMSESDWAELVRAGLEPGTIRVLRGYALVHPSPPLKEAPASEAKGVKKIPLPRFFVAYPHDPKAFPPWYYGPPPAEASSTSRYPARANPRGGRWRDESRSVWFHGRRL